MSEFAPVLLTLPTLTPALALEILPYGLTLHRLFVQANGRTHDIVIGPEAPEDHVTQKYTNTIIGRYSNRVPVGTHALERNGYKATFTAQANENPRVSLHGGPTGFDAVPWTRLDESTLPTLFSQTELALLPSSSSGTSHSVFRLVSPDGDQGYPGSLTVEVLVLLLEPKHQDRTYRLPGDTSEPIESDLGSLVIVYRAKVDKGVTPVNLTQHWGFNLNASLKDAGHPLSVSDHTLKLQADKIVARDSDSLHTGSYTPTVSTVHDHNGKTIGEGYPDAGYDDFYVFKNREGLAPKRVPLTSFTPEFNLLGNIIDTPVSSSAPLAELVSAKSGLKVVFDSNQPGVMFYSNGLSKPENGARKKIHGGSGEKGDGYAPGTAAFLEFHDILAAFLDASNKDKEDSLLTQDELYHNFVRLDVKFKDPKV